MSEPPVEGFSGPPGARSGPAVPRVLAERARDLADGRLTPVVPRDAATVILLRPAEAGEGELGGGAGVEAFLLRRTAELEFAPGACVFPGGSVDARDGDSGTGWAGPSPEEFGVLLDVPADRARALVCAAIRETFEESGVLLAGSGPGDVVDVSGPDWEQERLALLDRRESLSSLLERRGLGLRADLLRPWAHWITPELEPKRYDTRFFVAALPPGQHTRHVGGEADATMWITPAEAVAKFERDELPMMPPTIATLRELAEYASAADVLAAADSR
ncbi:MAG TPA: hypothetical protein VGI96_32055, partial [Streptosporangiaceae bacterium]